MNSLKNASSPYLLQHANNPVDWYPWDAEALSKAQRENKLIVVSIGYSACHWCHVMEHESFEDSEVAEVMNALYVNIKVDREERPDIDQIYMSALQLMNGSGGWPLNCILLPDQRPIYGGTYFRKSDWVNILSNIAKLFRTKPEELYAYADKLMTGVHQMERIMESNQNQGFSAEQLHELINKWQKYLDFDYGGTQGAPKFPVPINLQCLLRYETVFPNQHLDFYLQNTLYRIALGGIYDQLAGGIYRYSVDGEWKIPHFEKMLYDQAQSLALFAEAYRKYKNPLYLEVIDSTIYFLENELKNQQEGGYYAALDADSEGQEGKYYCWSTAEMRAMIPHADLLIEYYQLTEEGNFEHGLNNLIPLVDESDFLAKHQLSSIEWQNILTEAKLNLVKLRSQRVRPGLDDKQLCAWNALLVQGFVEAYQASSNEKYKQLAIDLIEFIETHLMEGSTLFRNYKDGRKSIPAFCDDYAFLLQAYLSVFQISADEHYLLQAEELLRHLIDHFYDQNSGLFWYTSNQAEELITRKQEYYDSVIPSSNSVLMHALNQLSRINGDPALEQISQKMFGALQELMLKYPPSFGNWIYYGLKMVCPPTELIITGLDAAEEYKSLMNKHIPTTLLLFSEKSSERGCFKNRVVAGKTLFYFCKDHACQLPLNSSNGILSRENLYE